MKLHGGVGRHKRLPALRESAAPTEAAAKAEHPAVLVVEPPLAGDQHVVPTPEPTSVVTQDPAPPHPVRKSASPFDRAPSDQPISESGPVTSVKLPARRTRTADRVAKIGSSEQRALQRARDRGHEMRRVDVIRGTGRDEWHEHLCVKCDAHLRIVHQYEDGWTDKLVNCDGPAMRTDCRPAG
jgi:hypothetical protein